ncbi:WD repeat-containing protein 88-like [Grus japonensis]|uniref:WD repeat-containing protein 88-like n=1 Tax=Grus japonensis TaxID=30415 RepID=A0ABC9XDB0_GRUJA
MAAGSGRGERLALGPELSPVEARLDHRELTAQVQFKTLRGHSDTVSSCHFCFEDTNILSCSYDRTMKLWVCYKCNNNKLKKNLKAEIKQGMLYRRED